MRSWYKNSVYGFSSESVDSILGQLSTGSTSAGFSVELEQNNAWREEINILKKVIPSNLQSSVFMEFNIPRMGHRIDALLLGPNFPYVLILEFKIGASGYGKSDINQVYDYALELKNFHKGSHEARIIPILIATNAGEYNAVLEYSEDGIAKPVCVNLSGLQELLVSLNLIGYVDADGWESSPYQPTPSIIEAARALYGNQNVKDITRSEGGSHNIETTSGIVSEIIDDSMNNSKKSIVFVTGVPGAGKTLVGLNIANQKRSEDKLDHAVFLSGNGPLVEVLQEALARDEVSRGMNSGCKVTKSEAKISTKAFIQNIHHFRDQALIDNNPPSEHVVIFDEAQRAWDKHNTIDFMRRKKNQTNFVWSESEYLISYMNRHQDWAVIVCLVGGGQEIHKGEGGISEWIESIKRSFPDWNVAISDKLQDAEYAVSDPVSIWLDGSDRVKKTTELHLAVSMRSFRAEKVSNFVKSLLDLDLDSARDLHKNLSDKYPIYITRDLAAAKAWLRTQARGTERYGMIASSKAMRLKPFAIDVASDAKPIHYFLDSEDDVRSSYFLEAVATEFQVQGLELDWALVGWDADLRLQNGEWSYHDFRGKKWQDIKKPINREYLKNAYRVLLTRARQGMVIFVPYGNYPPDISRQPQFYDETFAYLLSLGLPVIETDENDLGY